jgi:hypothetical protein
LTAESNDLLRFPGKHEELVDATSGSGSTVMQQANPGLSR